MANPPPSRPWFRLASMARPPPAPTPTAAPEPPPPQPRPPVARPAFRPPIAPTQPTQPQDQPIVAPAAPESAITAPPPATGVASVPTSPILRTASVPASPAAPRTASLPTSPAGPKTASVPTSPAAPRTASVPSSPKLQVLAPSSSVPSSPTPKIVLPSTSPIIPKAAPPPSVQPTISAAPTTTIATARVSTPRSAPRTIKPAPADKTPPQSPKTKPTAPPPSPLVLPPSQLKSETEPEPKIPVEAEQKTVLVQKTVEKPKTWMNWNAKKDFEEPQKPGIMGNDGKKDMAKDVEKKVEKGNRRKHSDSEEEMGMRVITIAGENKGAFMEVTHSPKKNPFQGNPHTLHHKNEDPKTGNESGNHSSGTNEGNPKKDKSFKQKALNPPPMTAFMNSNVQGVNNSLLFNTSCSHHDPGVHLALYRKPSGQFHIKDRGSGHHS